MKDNKIILLEKLLENFNVVKLEIKDDSENHVDHYSVETDSMYPSHVKIHIVSKDFEGLSLLERQRLVNRALQPAFQHGLHAASIKADNS